MTRFRWLLFAILLVTVSAVGAQPPQPRKVIDVHVHAGPAEWTGPGAPTNPVNEDRLRKVIAEMDRFGVTLAVISGPMAFVEHGMAKSILFGSDDFPLKDSIKSITSAPFLTDEQKGDILCGNAARFLKLDEAKVCH